MKPEAVARPVGRKKADQPRRVRRITDIRLKGIAQELVDEIWKDHWNHVGTRRRIFETLKSIREKIADGASPSGEPSESRQRPDQARGRLTSASEFMNESKLTAPATSPASDGSACDIGVESNRGWVCLGHIPWCPSGHSCQWLRVGRLRIGWYGGSIIRKIFWCGGKGWQLTIVNGFVSWTARPNAKPSEAADET